MDSRASAQFNRTFTYISLGIAVLLVVATIAGAKIISSRAANAPVAMSDLPAPLASSEQCAQLVAALPGSVLGHKRATIAEPAPAGAAAWQTTSAKRVTVRCGVDLPLQFTQYSQPVEIGGSRWLRVDDETPGSTMKTWYSVGRSPVVAVSADDEALGDAADPLEEIAEPVAALPAADPQPYPAPLADVSVVDGTTQRCAPLLADLPDQLAQRWSLAADLSTDHSRVWTALGQEPIVVACGVSDAPNYRAGLQVTQIDDIPWFEDEQLANGSTASVWYALGRDVTVAVSVPQAAAADSLPELGAVIAKHTASTETAR